VGEQHDWEVIALFMAAQSLHLFLQPFANPGLERHERLGTLHCGFVYTKGVSPFLPVVLEEFYVKCRYLHN